MPLIDVRKLLEVLALESSQRDAAADFSCLCRMRVEKMD